MMPRTSKFTIMIVIVVCILDSLLTLNCVSLIFCSVGNVVAIIATVSMWLFWYVVLVFVSSSRLPGTVFESEIDEYNHDGRLWKPLNELVFSLRGFVLVSTLFLQFTGENTFVLIFFLFFPYRRLCAWMHQWHPLIQPIYEG